VVASSLVRVSTSRFVKHQQDAGALRESYVRMFEIMLLLLAPMYAIATLVAEPMVVVVFGEQWRESAPLIGWMSLAYLAQAGFGHGQCLSFTTQHSGRVLNLSSIQFGLALAVSLVLAFFTGWGFMSVAIGYAVASIVGMLMMQRAVCRQLGLRFAQLAWAALPALLGAASAMGALWVLLQSTRLDPQTWRGLFIVGAVGLSIYGAVAAVTLRFTKRRQFF
jgi:O-antigen/teichoic acid export membrane protein